jgi:hypothetical protein
MFPFLNILQHYVEFDIRTIITLEKIFGARFFDGSINYLVHCHAIFLVFSNGLNLLSMVQTIVLAFLKCCALINLALITHFQQDDYPIFLDVVAHVEIGTFSN